MEHIFQLLADSDLIGEHEVLSLLQDEDFYYLKIKALIVDRSLLHIKIYLSDKEYNYSFHWQSETGELIIRWDNAPHHPDILTFPHHVHTGELTEESYNITLDDALKEIRQRVDLQNA